MHFTISRIMLNFHSLYRDCVWYKKYYIAICDNKVWVYLQCAILLSTNFSSIITLQAYKYHFRFTSALCWQSFLECTYFFTKYMYLERFQKKFVQDTYQSPLMLGLYSQEEILKIPSKYKRPRISSHTHAYPHTPVHTCTHPCILANTPHIHAHSCL